MSLLDEAKALGEFRGPSCTIDVLKLQHPDFASEIDELIEGVRNKAIQASKAGAVLRVKFEAKFSDDVVRRHASRLCACRS
jgi:hypothetical protein